MPKRLRFGATKHIEYMLAATPQKTHMKKVFIFILNLPWTLAGLLASLLSLPSKVSFSKNPLAIILHVKSFWWYTWLPHRKGVRAMATGHIIQLGPQADGADLEHELIHVRQMEREPFVHHFLYMYQNWRYGYRQNKYEREAYGVSGNRYLDEKGEWQAGVSEYGLK